MNADYLNAYRQWLRLHEKSESTVEGYCSDVDRLYRMLGSDWKRVLSATTARLNDYLERLRFEGNSVATVNRTVSALHSFYAYLLEQKKIRRSPAEGIATERTAEKLPDVFSEAEIRRLLTFPAEMTYYEIREYAVLSVLYASGMTAGELLALTPKDFLPEEAMIKCGVSEAVRYVPLFDRAVEALQAYLVQRKERHPAWTDEMPLFANPAGDRLTRQSLAKLLRKSGERADVSQPVTARGLRHTFATQLLENGAEPELLRELLGFSSVKQTKRYSRLISRRLRTDYLKYHPMGR